MHGDNLRSPECSLALKTNWTDLNKKEALPFVTMEMHLWPAFTLCRRQLSGSLSLAVNKWRTTFSSQVIAKCHFLGIPLVSHQVAKGTNVRRIWVQYVIFYLELGTEPRCLALKKDHCAIMQRALSFFKMVFKKSVFLFLEIFSIRNDEQL